MIAKEIERSGAAFATSPVDYAEAVRRLLSDHGSRRDALLPLLHALQREHGYVDDTMVPHIADALNISRADVHGVLTFYHDFRRAPPGRHHLKICRAESCRARGAMAIEQALLEAAGVTLGGTSIDGSITIDRMHCFGLCATGPNVMVDGRIRSRVDAAGVAAIMREISA